MRTKFGKSSCTSTSPDTSTCLLLHALITHGFKGNHDAQVRVFKIRRKKNSCKRVEWIYLFCFVFYLSLHSLWRNRTNFFRLASTAWIVFLYSRVLRLFNNSYFVLFKTEVGLSRSWAAESKSSFPTFFFVSNSPSKLRSSSVRVYICFVGKEGQQFKPLEGVCSPGRILKHPDATFTPSFNWRSPRYL